MFFSTFIFANIVVFVYANQKSKSCEGVQCKKTISMPLLDNMKASLKADLDITEMNEYLQIYIQQQVNKGVETAIKELVANVVQNETAKAELRIQTQLMTKTELSIQKHLKDRQQYAFFATMTSNKKDMKGDEVVVFDIVPLNVGGSYSGTTGKFTCQEDGLYTFSWTTVSTNKKDFTSVLTINGSRNVASNVVDNDATSDAMTGSSTVIVQLKRGDQVWLKVHSGEGGFLHANWSGKCSMFSGFKIN